MEKAKVSLDELKPEYSGVISDWLQDDDGRETLRLLGNVVPADFATDPETEAAKVNEINNDDAKIAWTIECDAKPVGILEVNLTGLSEISAPNISIFIGDKNTRGKGIGTEALLLVMDEVKKMGYDNVNGRALEENIASQKMMLKAGFIPNGEQYTDANGFVWQNFVKNL